MPTRTPIPQITPEPAIRITATAIDDAAETTLITVQHAPAGQPAYMQCYAVTRAGVVTPVVRDDALGKADSGAARRFRDGTVRLFVSEADPVAASPGSSSGVTFYDTPNVFPPQAAQPGSPADVAALRAEVAQLRQQLALHEARLDRIAVAAQG